MPLTIVRSICKIFLLPLFSACAGEVPVAVSPSDAAVLDAADQGADIPTDIDPAVTRGSIVFRRSCAICHGARGAGSGDGPDLRLEVPANTDESIQRIVRDGGRRMPMIALEDAQRADVFTFLRATFGPYQGP
jgi:mono/diheme cytochrome c family protein